MRYIGSKRRIAKEILSIILNDRKPGQWYVEPFVGGCNTIDKVTGNRLGSDINKYLISMLIALQDGWIPPDILTEEEYLNIKNNREMYPDHMVGFAGIGCSFGCKWFGSFSKGKRENGEVRNYALEFKRNLLEQQSLLQGIEFVTYDYLDLNLPNNSIVYCDPPYSKTEKGLYVKEINMTEFWAWVEEQENKGHLIYISEYEAPSNFDCLWAKPSLPSFWTRARGRETVKQSIEKLFRIRGKNSFYQSQLSFK
jgi:DNA adenine methylase